MPLMVKMTEIDSEVISNIRKLKKKSRAYKILEYAIKQDGQLNPILIRQLTDTEKQTAKEGAVYGIIDGHHRYKIAQANSQDKILATVLDYVPSDERDIKIEDVKMALRMNSAITMTTLQKGEILYRLTETTGKKVDELAEELFGIKTSMAYRCLNAYKKHNNISTVDKSRL